MSRDEMQHVPAAEHGSGETDSGTVHEMMAVLCGETCTPPVAKVRSSLKLSLPFQTDSSEKSVRRGVLSSMSSLVGAHFVDACQAPRFPSFDTNTCRLKTPLFGKMRWSWFRSCVPDV